MPTFPGTCALLLQIGCELPFITFEGDGEDIEQALVWLSAVQRATLDTLVHEVR